MEEFALHAVVAIIAALVMVGAANLTRAQSSANPAPENGVTCPPRRETLSNIREFWIVLAYRINGDP